MTVASQPEWDPLVEVEVRVAELVDPIRVVRRREVRDRRAHRKVVVLDPWVFPSLLEQLRAAATPTLRAAADGARVAPGSRMLVDVGAVDALGRIGAGVAVWRYVLDVDARDTVDEDLRALVGVAGGLDRVTLVAVAYDVDRWWRRARAYARFDG